MKVAVILDSNFLIFRTDYMKKNILFCAFVSTLVFLTACSEEITPVFPHGKWDVYHFEFRNCEDSTMNVSVDIDSDSVYDIDGRMVKFLSYQLELLQDTGYFINQQWNIDGKDTMLSEEGDYYTSGFNDIIFDESGSVDTIFKNGIFLRIGDHIEMSWLDTFPEQSGCGTYIQANRF